MEIIAIILNIGKTSATLLIIIGCADIFTDSVRGLTGRPGGKISEASIKAIIHGTIGIMIFYVLEELSLRIGLI